MVIEEREGGLDSILANMAILGVAAHSSINYTGKERVPAKYAGATNDNTSDSVFNIAHGFG